MDTGETVSFTCDPNAKGFTLKIAIKGRSSLTPCEVMVFGKGMAYSNLNKPTSNLKKQLSFTALLFLFSLDIPVVRGMIADIFYLRLFSSSSYSSR